MLIFVAGSAALRVYIGFVLDHNTAYVTLATPIAALLFFYILAFGVLIGAEFNAAFEELHPSRRGPPGTGPLAIAARRDAAGDRWPLARRVHRPSRATVDRATDHRSPARHSRGAITPSPGIES